MGQLADAGLIEACRVDVRRLLGGVSVEDLPDLNRVVAKVAERVAPGMVWTPASTLKAVERLVLSVGDLEITRPAVWAAKVLLGYSAAPGEDDLVPAHQETGFTVSMLRRDRIDGSQVAFSDSIDLRRAYVLPVFSLKDQGNLRGDRPPSKSVSRLLDGFTAELLDFVRSSAEEFGDKKRRVEVVDPIPKVAHLASTEDDRMGLPRLLAPNGPTYLRWVSQAESGDPGPGDYWTDRIPSRREEKIFAETMVKPISIPTLYLDSTIRLVVERFGGSTRWDSRVGPLPLLDAIQTCLEKRLRDESSSMPLAISQAQAAFLGRMILDPREKSDVESRHLLNRPISDHFPEVENEWSGAEMLQNYHRWIVDIGYALDPSDVDWSRNQYGDRGREYVPERSKTVLPHYAPVLEDFYHLAYVNEDDPMDYMEDIPAIHAIMYSYGYDTMSPNALMTFLEDVMAELGYELGDWLRGFIGMEGYSGKRYGRFLKNRRKWHIALGIPGPTDRIIKNAYYGRTRSAWGSGGAPEQLDRIIYFLLLRKFEGAHGGLSTPR